MHRSHPCFAAGITAALALPALSASACDWDADTLDMETHAFPEVIEVLTGTYVRHSSVWYEWRVRDRTARLGGPEGPWADPVARLALLDDLAIAYDRLGRSEEAVATARTALALDPNRYASLSNLGTVLLHAGHPGEGLLHLRRAVEVNPHAHFDREKFQIAVWEYVESRRVGGTVRLPLHDPEASDPEGNDERTTTFPQWLRDRHPTPGLSVHLIDDWDHATLAEVLVGMVSVGGRADPALLDVLGQVLLGDGGARQLSARAYLAASYAAPSPEAATAYRAAADVALFGVTTTSRGAQRLTLDGLESLFASERAEGDKRFAALRADEARWIAQAPDPEAAFAAKYFRRDRLVVPAAPPEPSEAPLAPAPEETRPAVAGRGSWAAAQARPPPPPTSAPVVSPALGLAAACVLLAGAGLLATRSSRRRPAARIRRPFVTSRAFASR